MPAYIFRNLPAGAGVTVKPVGSNTTVASGTTTSDGTYSVTLPAGDYIATARSGRYAVTAAEELASPANPDALASIEIDRAGDNVFLFKAWQARDRELRRGTSAAPTAGGGPMVKMSQTENITDLAVQMGGNAVDNEANAALHVAATCVAGSLGQVNAVAGTAKGAPSGTDVVGLWGAGDATGGTGIGTGAYLEGRRSASTSRAVGSEIRVQNEGGADTTLNSTGISAATGLWVSTSSSLGHKSSVGVSLGTVDTSKFIVGYHVTTNSVVDAAFRDEGGSYASFQSAGAHSFGLNLTDATFTGGYAVALPASTNSAGGITWGGDAFLFRNGVGSLYLDASGGLEFNANFVLSDARNIVLGATAGNKIGTAPGQKLGFYGAAPVARPTAVAVTIDAVHAALVSLGLIAA